jgi:hypothetical protein
MVANRAGLAGQGWSWPRRVVWGAIAVVVALAQGPSFVASLRPARSYQCDFVQEWASGRNRFEGRPIYEDQETSLARYLGFHRDPSNPTDRFFLSVNAHPPTAVLLALPLALLDYPDAVLAWNLLSLGALAVSVWLLNRHLHVAASPWALLPLVTVLLLCGPFRQQVIQGQLNLVLLLLLTGTWAADRSGRPLLAGALLATATAIKLFPGFVVLYFLVRRDGRAVAATALWFLLLSGLTAGVLGTGAYRDYLREVLPQAGAAFESSWWNASFAGFWSRLFNPMTDQHHVLPLWQSPPLALAGTLLCRLAVVALLAWAVWRARTPAQRDLAFGLVLVGMLLVSPLTWDHYFLLLPLPVLVVWGLLPPRGITRWLFAVIPAVFCLNLKWFFGLTVPGGWPEGTAGPVQTLTVVALPFYALLALFVVGLVLFRRRASRANPPGPPSRL